MSDTSANARLLYCHCAYAKVIPAEVKREVLRKLSESRVAFDAVADLCEMSARKDPALARLVADTPLKIAACYPRALRWLFHAAKMPMPETGIEVLNMREKSAAEVMERMLAADLVEVDFAAEGGTPSKPPGAGAPGSNRADVADVESTSEVSS